MIKFGTDGWRAKIADDFTFDNIKHVTLAFINHLKKSGHDKAGVAVGFDNRFQSEDFAQTTAEVCAENGIKTYLSKYSLPSPALSYFVKTNNLNAGIMITASHNPPEWNGFKIKESFGGSARPEFTKAVEAEINHPTQSLGAKTKIEMFDPKPGYLKHISSFVDLEKIKNANIKIVLDCMHGSGIGYLSNLLEIDEINSNRDPLFGGLNPEPIPQNLIDLTSYTKDLLVKSKNTLIMGAAIDGDADRIGCVDSSGVFISSHNIFSLLLKHLVENKKMDGKIIKTFNISRLIELQAKKYGLQIEEVPIGFKYIADKMLKENILIGGEESGGIGIKGNIPERDGSLCTLLLAELIAYNKKTLKQLLDEIMDEFGYSYYDRIDLHGIDREMALRKIEVMKGLKAFANSQIVKIETLDGLKLDFSDSSWILFRMSGTEPLLRIYAEARTFDQVELLLSAGQKAIQS
ncbi:MAG: phosphoglucomutase/phosphomannomutase alpha/beta/alpha domain i [Candidatus Saganbacteria bacterium]|uniref:Phosphoglucomutase/phosphomannomutase alpha/beta/alpha domain i n=1 Tax=Candidatus Saganbacteria bacterium TaxID=2575572 RepID=A0A833L170_UNCSA|nr:MAG: phosphoglucomutase/phosphomannomutase alpha/beta/alpha domain i [Candidatus Saganbacteria bacterium]